MLDRFRSPLRAFVPTRSRAGTHTTANRPELRPVMQDRLMLSACEPNRFVEDTADTANGIGAALRLTDLCKTGAGGSALSGGWRSAVYLAFFSTRELIKAMPRDLERVIRRPSRSELRLESGTEPANDATRIALYVHYSASGQVSEMVRRQLTELRQSGFSIVFITMAVGIPKDQWQAIRRLAALVVQRRNFGLDFGAWQDLVPEVRRRWPALHELLLANDSILGPIYPVAPAIETMRAGGEGLFGMTESLQGGAHLQSYFLLARGASAVGDVMQFLQKLRLSSSKWILIRRSEVRLSRWMRRRGHRVAALFGYERLVRATVANPEERGRLRTVYDWLRDIEQVPDAVAASAMYRWPLNPTHHLWRVLTTQFHFPFLKTELILRNPAGLPGVARWPAVVPPQAPCPLPVLQAHLATLQATRL